MKKLILNHGRDLGDCAMVTIAIRDLHCAYPGEYLTDVRTRYLDLWANSPYITPLDKEDPEVEWIDTEYGLIQNAGSQSFSDAFRIDLQNQLKREIPFTSMNIDIHLTDKEKGQNIVDEKISYPGKYWLLNAGYKADAVLKYYPFWQDMVDALKNKIQIIQIGAADDIHDDLEDVFSLVGQTTVRELLQVIYRSEGTIGPVSMQFVLATAWSKPSVVMAGGKEPPRWQMYNYHHYLNVCGCLKCAPENGCWVAKFEDCKSRVGNVPRCFAMISPDDVARAVLSYYEGGLLSF